MWIRISNLLWHFDFWRWGQAVALKHQDPITRWYQHYIPGKRNPWLCGCLNLSEMLFRDTVSSVYFSFRFFIQVFQDSDHNLATISHDRFIWFFLSFFRWISGNYLEIRLTASFCTIHSLQSMLSVDAAWWKWLEKVTKPRLLLSFCSVTAYHLVCVCYHYMLELLCSQVFLNKNIVLKYNVCVAWHDVQYSFKC
jgi:hypothetical protein